MLSQFGNVPADVLAGTVEKLVAKMDEAELASTFRTALPSMPQDASAAFVEAMFDAFRDRGESSEDALEGAGTTLDGISRRDESAYARLVEYARSNPGVLREAVTLYAQEHPQLVAALPGDLRSAIERRLAETA